MINAEVLSHDDHQLKLVYWYPDGHSTEPVEISKGEVMRQLYFYNRLYITDTLINWLQQRVNVYKHIEAKGQVAAAESMINTISERRKTTLKAVCQLVIQLEPRIMQLAPGQQSRYRHAFEKDVLPVLVWCRDNERGVEYNS